MIRLKKYDTEYAAPPIGFTNTGVMCWFNSLLQMLLGVSAFNQCVLDERQWLSDNPLAAAYIRLAEAILPNSGEYDPEDLGRFSGCSLEILHGLTAACPGANLDFGQQCASEGFTRFIESMCSKPVDEIFMNAYKQTITCTACNNVVSSTRDIGNYIRVPPTKNMATQAEIDAWNVHVSGLIPDHPDRDVIANFRSQAEFQRWIHKHDSCVRSYQCDKCSKTHGVIKRTEMLALVMDAIVLSFDRQNPIDPTWFPSELAFRSSDHIHIHKYALVGRICWSGSFSIHGGVPVSSGHYWAHSLREGVWRCLNDSSVTPGSPHPDPYTFMVVYHYVGDVKV